MTRARNSKAKKKVVPLDGYVINPYRVAALRELPPYHGPTGERSVARAIHSVTPDIAPTPRRGRPGHR